MSTVLLGEELRFRRQRRRVFVGVGDAPRARVCPPGGGRGGQDRPEAARRGSLEGPCRWLARLGGEPLLGFLVSAVASWAAPGVGGWDGLAFSRSRWLSGAASLKERLMSTVLLQG